MKVLKIKTIKDIVGTANNIIEHLVSQKAMTGFNLLVDHGEGTLSNCAWTPTTKITQGQHFLAVEDYTKIMILLLTHPRVKELEYHEKEHTVTAVFSAPEMQEVDQIENPYEEP